MTTQPRLTAEEDAQALFDAWYVSEAPDDSLVDRIAAALRKRDERKRWVLLRRSGPNVIVECETDGVVVASMTELLDSNFSHELNLTAYENNAARRDAGLEDANA